MLDVMVFLLNFYEILKGRFKTLDQARQQGEKCLESGATMLGCEHFETLFNAVSGSWTGLSNGLLVSADPAGLKIDAVAVDIDLAG
jgi:hypothetical protein